MVDHKEFDRHFLSMTLSFGLVDALSRLISFQLEVYFSTYVVIGRETRNCT